MTTKSDIVNFSDPNNKKPIKDIWDTISAELKAKDIKPEDIDRAIKEVRAKKRKNLNDTPL